jgi:hypothetical protein
VKFCFFSNPKTPALKFPPKMFYSFSGLTRVLTHSSPRPLQCRY